MTLPSPRHVLAAAIVGVSALAVTACTTTLPRETQTGVERRDSINERADAALKRLYEVAPNSRELVSQAKGVLIFPRVIGGGFVVGLEHGDGVLRVNGKNRGYYSTSSGSVGLQAGAQSKAIVMVFRTQEALDKFLASNGWTAGVDATVAVANIGANGALDLNTIREPIVGFVMTNVGLMAGVSLEGTKINRIDDRGAGTKTAQ
ncbi:BPSL1445 family SYLF domain-containing lipoprotein [Parapusillimonas granuli]|uniref:Twin-arginine translocation pathway signal n=1 Tax=Parapusillimonas granuli TaxID=380911 RepID=A0A853FT84_9BURK|nr:YSC84-related protein [Parapusillimonas granuli]MEB2398234.1 YSC84-related protein [Alcaligenaceae bacterium]NYT49075.1 twin-arginine translocation pathway signal [Parapusillimonas granuli]